MTGALSPDQLADALKAGVQRTASFMGQLTDYHGGPVATEYLMTGDIARALADRNLPVVVEGLNRNFLNAMVAMNFSVARKKLRSKRTDVAVVSPPYTLAMIEVKIGARSLKRLEVDLDKITTTMSFMTPEAAHRTIGAVVYQIHVSGRRNRIYKQDFAAAISKIETRIEADLDDYKKRRVGFNFSIVPLQGEADGIVERDKDYINGEWVWGQDGHATRYYAIFIISTRAPRPPPRSIKEMKARSLEAMGTTNDG